MGVMATSGRVHAAAAVLMHKISLVTTKVVSISKFPEDKKNSRRWWLIKATYLVYGQFLRDIFGTWQNSAHLGTPVYGSRIWCSKNPNFFIIL